MTPAQTRQRGWRSLKSAAILLDHGEADIAAYLAGGAAELLLKARYCAKEGLAELPSDQKELAKHKLNVHRLDKLLTLCEGEYVQRSALDAIDWNSIAEWRNEDRYKPINSISAETARRRIEHTDKLFKALVNYEIVESL